MLITIGDKVSVTLSVIEDNLRVADAVELVKLKANVDRNNSLPNWALIEKWPNLGLGMYIILNIVIHGNKGIP